MPMREFVFINVVFPAYAGMNRIRRMPPPPQRCVPRVRGDEPLTRRADGTYVYVFPAYAGMNRDERADTV